jgi:hypothetical protein
MPKWKMSEPVSKITQSENNKFVKSLVGFLTENKIFFPSKSKNFFLYLIM